jgi:hypothetical protein
MLNRYEESENKKAKLLFENLIKINLEIAKSLKEITEKVINIEKRIELLSNNMR